MESNQILIGIQFYKSKTEDIKLELLVLRDVKLGQLLDGIRYGLAKKCDDPMYSKCMEIYKECMGYRSTKGELRKVIITSYNSSINKQAAENGRVIISESDFDKKLCDLGFLSSTRLVFDCTSAYKSIEIDTSRITEAFNPGTQPQVEKIFPEYNISSRQLYCFDEEPVDVIPPSEPPKKPDQNYFFMILPTVLTVGITLLVRSLMFGGGPAGMTTLMLSAAMGIVALITTAISLVRQKSQFKKNLEQWRTNYESYVNSLIDRIRKRQAEDTAALHRLYPDANDLLSSVDKGVFSADGSIFSRRKNDSDFLTVRLGISNEVESTFQISGERRDSVFSAGNFDLYNTETGDVRVKLHVPEDEDYAERGDQDTYLSNLPHAISERFKYLEHAPLLLNLPQCGTLGIVSKHYNLAESVIDRMIFELCYYHAPEDLQFVVLFKPEKDMADIEERMSLYKFLPHFRGLFPDKSQFVFDPDSAGQVFGTMLNLMAERQAADEAAEEKGRRPHIVFIVYEEYGLKEHAFAEFLPETPADGKPYENLNDLTFVFVKEYKEHLPAYCGSVINLTYNSATLTPRYDENKKTSFGMDVWNTQVRSVVYNSYKILSALSYSRISQNGRVPSNVGLFEILGISRDNIDVKTMWGETEGERTFNVTDSIAVPLGFSDNGVTALDLHEKADGPHMLVAGTTGSGKSETIISYLLGLCLRFRPDELSLMLVDMKGGGFIKRIGELPHVVGSVTDVDGDENGTGAEYMLRRFLNALSAEIKRRKLLFNKMRVDSIDAYISATRNIDAHIKSKASAISGKEEEDEMRRMAQEEKLSHLVLVVDEFTELKRFSNENSDVDFIGEITTIARVGRSLGFHIILVSQNIEGAITDDIRVNSKSRLCLKVATRQASKEMIGNELAAAPSMPGNGRAYLLVGTGSKFEYFQSAYSGASAYETVQVPVEIIQAEKNGPYSVFYQSQKDNVEIIDREKQMREDGMMETQLSCVVKAIVKEFESGDYDVPHIVFQPPLPSRMTFKNGKAVVIKAK